MRSCTSSQELRLLIRSLNRCLNYYSDFSTFILCELLSTFVEIECIMITRIGIKNFKKLDAIDFELSQSVVIIGPNNSGKSTIFQALCLWETGVRNFIAAYQKHDLNRNGAVSINRKDLLNSPIADARYLWKDRKVTFKNDKNQTRHVVLEVVIEGETNGEKWYSKAEFEFYNTESFSCKVVSGITNLIQIFEKGYGIHFGFLQPMSGISTQEDKLTQGSVDRKLGEGKTAEVLRNICYEMLFPETAQKNVINVEENWNKLYEVIRAMFGIKIQKPEFVSATGLINLEYIENDIRYDIASGGRGFQQTLLLFAYMFANPNTILLLDEPDAHLEVIRQREAFQRLNEIANETNTQVIIASHSEVVLDEAAEASNIIALIENQIVKLNASSRNQSIKYIKKSLTEIGWEKYFLARSKKHVLYLEGSTDLQMLLALASILNHKVEPLLRVANVDYTSDNVPGTATRRFAALQEIFPELKGLALFDNIPNLQMNPKLEIICWERRELENYFASPDLLLKYAKLLNKKHPQFSTPDLERTMQETISEFTVPAYLKNSSNEWWRTAKISDEWLDKIFPEFYKKLNIPWDFYKRDYYLLIQLMDPKNVDKEVVEKLDRVYNLLI